MIKIGLSSFAATNTNSYTGATTIQRSPSFVDPVDLPEKAYSSISTIDAWSKRTPKMVINDWYMTDDYHEDHGEGADFYSAGASRGCGGNGLWAADKLWVSRNFVNSRVLANDPIRV